MEYEYTKLESLRDAMEKRQKDKAGKLLEEMMLSSPAPRVGSGKVTGAAKAEEAVDDKQRTSASPSDVGDYYSFLPRQRLRRVRQVGPRGEGSRLPLREGGLRNRLLDAHEEVTTIN